MMRGSYLFTSESVSEGHPDKVCDRISDEIVDLVFREARKAGMDPWDVRVACETLATTNRVVIAGEVRVPPTLMKKDRKGREVINPAKFKTAARKAIRAIGYATLKLERGRNPHVGTPSTNGFLTIILFALAAAAMKLTGRRRFN